MIILHPSALIYFLSQPVWQTLTHIRFSLCYSAKNAMKTKNFDLTLVLGFGVMSNVMFNFLEKRK